MSAFSLDKLTRHKYRQEFEDNILYNFDNYFYHKNFRVGGGIKDEKELKHNIIFYKMLCTDVCPLVDYIQSQIEGCLEPEPKRKTLTQLFSHHHCCKEEPITDPLCKCRVN